MKQQFRIVLFATALSFSFFFSAAQKPSTAIGLNDYLVSITDSLYEEGRKWGTAYSKASETKNFSSLGTVRRKLESFVERKQLEVLLMKDIGGSEKLRLAMLEFLFFESLMMKEAFAPVEKLNSSSSENDIKKAIEHLSNMAEKEAEFLKKVNKAQEAYAAKNGFTIEKEY